MITRTSDKVLTFRLPFSLKGVDRVLAAGGYSVLTDEELIEGLSFPVYRRVATMILLPVNGTSSVEMVVVDPLDLQQAQDRDEKAEDVPETKLVSGLDLKQTRHRL